MNTSSIVQLAIMVSAYAFSKLVMLHIHIVYHKQILFPKLRYAHTNKHTHTNTHACMFKTMNIIIILNYS